MPTEVPRIAVFAAVFFAALIQSTTGIGFGLIATPFLLITLTGSSAVQITIILSLVMSVLLSVRSYQDCNRTVLATLMVGGAVGLPIGLAAFRSVDPETLKVLAGAAVLLFAISVVRHPVTTAPTTSKRPSPFLLGASILSGAMGVCLAMPGPAVIGSLRARCDSERSVRATLFTYFVAAYGAALALQLGLARITAKTLWMSLMLLPAMVIGIAAGHVLEPHLSRQQIKVGLLLILLATSITLLITGLPEVSW